VNDEVEAPQLAAAWEEAWVEARDEARPYGNAQSHPRIQPWRDRFRALGVSPKEFPSSIEALLRRTLKGSDPFTINPMVDFYNTVSLHHTVPAGGFDLEHINGPLELRRTRVDDTFLAMDAETPLTVPDGEVAYADGTTILTRHFVWRQARAGLITASTRSVFLVSEVLGELEPGVAEKVLDEFATGLRAYFAVAPLLFLVDEQQPGIAWENH
jgi:DNA/RNA-binding domain of Phe-tRNA-synthetase-like protein